MSKIIDNFVLMGDVFKSNQQGEIYKARNILNDNIVTMKVVKIDKFLQKSEVKDQILNEISVIKNLASYTENIVKIHKMLKSSNHIYIVYEFQEENLLNYNLMSYSEKELVLFLTKIVKSYEIIYQNNIIHNNLSLENIYIKDNLIKFDEFGLSQNIQKILPIKKELITENMAPEVQQGGLPSVKSDIYLLGVIFKQIIKNQQNYSELLKGMCNQNEDERFDLYQLKQCLFTYEKQNNGSEVKNNKFLEFQKSDQKTIKNNSVQLSNEQQLQNSIKNLSAVSRQKKLFNDQPEVFQNLKKEFQTQNTSTNEKDKKRLDFEQTKQKKDTILILQKERNKYILIFKILQDIPRLQLQLYDQQLQVCMIFIFQAKLIISNIKQSFSFPSQSSLEKYFDGSRLILENFKQTNQFKDFQKIIQQESERIDSLFQLIETKLREQKSSLDINPINFKFKFIELMRQYVKFIYTTINKSVQAQNDPFNLYLHINDIFDAYNMDNFFIQNINQSQPNLLSQHYYENIKGFQLDYLINFLNSKQLSFV